MCFFEADSILLLLDSDKAENVSSSSFWENYVLWEVKKYAVNHTM